MAVTIQLRRDTTANWTSVNPTPAAGEMCIDTTLGTFRIGDGATAWASLPEHKTLPTAAADSDFAVGVAADGSWIKKTLAETQAILGVGGSVPASAAEADFLLGDSTTGNWKKATLAEAKTALGIIGTLGGSVEASTAESDFLAGDSTTGNWKKLTLAQAQTALFAGGTIDGGGAS